MEAAMRTNVYTQYKAQALSTLTMGEIVVKLFEEASKQISTAIFVSETDPVRAFNGIMKSVRIIRELNNSLDMNRPISVDLRRMYEFLIDKLIETAGSKDQELLKDLLSLVDDLKESFRQAERMSRIP